MLGRAEVVDILIRQGMSEAFAWHIALNMAPEYLEILDERSVQCDLENIISEHVSERAV